MSFVVKRPDGKYLHHNAVVAILNDLFGIQSRGGCSCAGPYGHRYVYDSVAAMAQGASWHERSAGQAAGMSEVMAVGSGQSTTFSDCVWLPIRFYCDIPRIDWPDEWRIEDYTSLSPMS